MHEYTHKDYLKGVTIPYFKCFEAIRKWLAVSRCSFLRHDLKTGIVGRFLANTLRLMTFKIIILLWYEMNWWWLKGRKRWNVPFVEESWWQHFDDRKVVDFVLEYKTPINVNILFKRFLGIKFVSYVIHYRKNVRIPFLTRSLRFKLQVM